MLSAGSFSLVSSRSIVAPARGFAGVPLSAPWWRAVTGHALARWVRPAGACGRLPVRFPVRWWWSGLLTRPPLLRLPPPFPGGVACP